MKSVFKLGRNRRAIHRGTAIDPYPNIIVALLLFYTTSISVHAAKTATSVHCSGNGSATVYSHLENGVAYSSVHCSSGEEKTTVMPSGITSNLSYSLAPYTTLTLFGALNVTVEMGEENRVVVTGDSNYVEAVEVNSANDALVIRQSNTNTGNSNLHVAITSTTLQKLAIAGAGNTRINGDFPRGLSIDKKGAGKVHLAGQAKYLELNLAGAGNIEAKGFETNVVRIDAAGAGKVSVCARESVSGTLTGAVHFKVYCHPARTAVSTRGAATVRY